jgi:hypothetical protein
MRLGPHREIKDITYDRLKEALHYNPKTGVWTWRVSTARRINVGDIAGHVSKTNGYRRIKIDGKLYLSIRLAFLYMEGYFPEHDVDHINRIRDDDRWANLREVSRQCNIRNAGVRCTNKSGVKGVHWDASRGKWVATVTVNYKDINLGRHCRFRNAVLARFEAERQFNMNACDMESSAYQYLTQNNLIER